MNKEQKLRPKHIHSYEFSDADGNRGIWLDWDECPNCSSDVHYDEEYCCECGQNLDWEELEEDYWEV